MPRLNKKHKHRQKRKKPLFFVGVCTLIFLHPEGLHAQDEDNLPEINIVAEKKEVLEQSYHAAQVILVDEINALNLSLSDVLAKEPGLVMRRLGARGSFSSLSIRGLGNNNVTFVLDGVPLISASMGQPDFSLYPLEQIERIDIYRGDSPTSFNRGLGGIVHLKTKLKLKDYTQVKIKLGDFGAREVHLAQSVKIGGLRTTLTSSIEKSLGRFEYYDDQNTLYNLDDDQFRQRLNNDYTLFAYGLNLRHPIADAKIIFNHNGRIRQQGVPGTGTIQAQQTSAKEHEFNQRLTMDSLSFLDKAIELKFAGDFLLTRRQFKDPQNEVGLGVSSMHSELQQWGVDSGFRYRFNKQNMLSLNPRWATKNYVQSENANEVSPLEIKHAEDSLYVGSAYRYILNAFLKLKISLRHSSSKYTTTHKNTSPETKVRSQTSPAITVMGHYKKVSWGLHTGNYHRFPTLLEFYGDGGKTSVPNIDLQPEQGQNVDLGLKFKITPNMQTSLNLYASQSDNLILILQNSQQTLRAENISKNLIYGAEIAEHIKLSPIALKLSYTYLMAQDKSEILGFHHNRLPGLAPHNIQTRLSYKAAAFKLYTENEFRSQSYLDRANQRLIPQRFFHHVGFQTNFEKSPWHFALVVHNILNKRFENINLPDQIEKKARASIVDYMGYPLSGRLVKVSLTWNTP
ncbi:MAG: TonB-dependent receptor [Myxococcota bacterium]|jgi:iron complex outermembrane receptor protein|nr:TonB-dependent receptor [Myxococcota bacterium]